MRKDDAVILPEGAIKKVGLGKFLLSFVSAHFSFKLRSLEHFQVFKKIVKRKNLAKVLAYSKDTLVIINTIVAI